MEKSFHRKNCTKKTTEFFSSRVCAGNQIGFFVLYEKCTHSRCFVDINLHTKECIVHGGGVDGENGLATIGMFVNRFVCPSRSP